MSLNPDQLGRNALELVRELVGIVGARPAGSLAERQAAQWVAGHLTRLGYELGEIPVPFPSPLRFRPYWTVPAVALLAGALLLPSLPWASVVLLLVVTRWSDWLARWLGRRPAQAASLNLIALPANVPITAIDLLLTAHLDSAPAQPYTSGPLYSARNQAPQILQRVALIQALLGLLAAIGLDLPPAVLLAIWTVSGLTAVGVILLEVWTQWGARGQVSPGANDNGSGLAVLLETARVLAASSQPAARVGLAFTGAEETGLQGAQALAAWLQQQGARPRVICVDMVGAGDGLRIITGTDLPPRASTYEDVNQWLERANPGAQRFRQQRRSGDYAAFSRAGIPVGTLEANGSPAAWQAYHTVQDQIELLNPELLGETVFTLVRLVELWKPARE